MGVVTATVRRLFTKEGEKAYDLLEWVKVDSKIVNPRDGSTVFEQLGCEFTSDWSTNAVNIVAQKYFSGTPGTASREVSLKDLINRVVDTVATHGLREGYFEQQTDADSFKEELKYILATQRAAFNSPVWFNIGAEGRSQQASACFILGIEDSMPSILNWYREEGMIFKGGSGSGINLSVIRSSYEKLGKSAGTASGPLSFMRGADASAGAIKSGGKTRRAAKMVILNVDHPDILEFIWCKAKEERKARVLKSAGFDMDLDGVDSYSVQYQNANNSVRVTDDFMLAVENDEDWNLMSVTAQKVVRTLKARQIWREIAQASWECADPGLQFDTTINHWHTTPNAGRINGSNPCSEYMHLDNSACNLASINLLKYLNNDGSFAVDEFEHTVDMIFMAQEILVGYSDYPTESITKNAKAYRELGLGYANLGALLMALGLPYDSEEGRALAAAITALMTGRAYLQSAKIAKEVGPFAGFRKDQEGVVRVLGQHRDALKQIDASLVSERLLIAAQEAWDGAIELAEKYGVRNSQASVLAPTGTIGLMMDCDTTGIEPDLGLVKYKKLVGGGSMNIVNQTVPRALKALGYGQNQIDAVVSYIDKEKTIVGAPELKDKHLPVFACSMGDNVIHYQGHIKMMSAVQPFLSGAISKTVNMPESATVEEIEMLHMESWKLGLKAVAIYRDNCKVGQPLSMAKKGANSTNEMPSDTVRHGDDHTAHVPAVSSVGSQKRRMPRVRKSRTYSFTVSDARGYVTVGEYDDGTPGEIFLRIAKQGSTLSGIMDAFAISVSLGLQYGVPLKTMIRSFLNTNFAPSGITDDHDIKTTTSIIDYIFRRLALDYLSFDDQLELGLATYSQDVLVEGQASLLDQVAEQEKGDVEVDNQSISPVPIIFIPEKISASDISAPMCFSCGNQTQKAGSCYVCTTCGATTGCS
jgi:ribonucleoside-diphosphate reductase alpha chain